MRSVYTQGMVSSRFVRRMGPWVSRHHGLAACSQGNTDLTHGKRVMRVMGCVGRRIR
ncbi:hypothetical protein GA0061078_0352 [Bifidobacterium bohemicum]|uniref:Uncharacterized protein n=1 Tax=Bifidobacterium bohemicum DSM 22767 TaxID=1437606 RepID=A0A086ZJA1_9BIFI|nr:hypothetical protein BBOH_0073 [Bifidobacterium bohemicum DSM 22767]SCB76424.1 hypothetical protein GA0061078_0352 [Bifidobacterium bohemicum]